MCQNKKPLEIKFAALKRNVARLAICIYCTAQKMQQLKDLSYIWHLKMKSLNQGLGLIPASKKWGSGSDPRVKKSCCGTYPSDY